ncbi:hypothetical protein [Xanthomonas campestris]|uniref:hypothetical protein n=1 Tax=Xanthomonas campestris TaxID=339 RepID=UPI002AD4B2DE|nr:hypothetical protein [Xanthomonas campestris]MEA0681702.1 hypothetical protein [Xanthomonas campestris pv. campestris]MEA0814369.1 hypothetical protein [Xanthomonas campestris pv. campestris]MEB1326731.1 hypothetical protein [Xanthomonas campestris pv. campestris]MEB1540479.1 hypothetical protein [Xanthomonas campestris pv. campestris]MEB2197543.1 hypothetical protein [Xanthomonas campestris pv. campestris]
MTNAVMLTPRRKGVFCFTAKEIALRVKEQGFYLEQAKGRLLSPFALISEEAEAVEKKFLDNPPEFPNPEDGDMSVVCEAAFHESLEHYDLLHEMRERTILSIAAGMYHHFDKSFRVRVARELRQAGWVIGTKTREEIWRSDWGNLEDLFKAFGWEIASIPGYGDLEALRLVVNVFKHGEGPAFEKLKLRFPRFIPKLEAGEDPWLYVDYTHMSVTEAHLDEFSDAIVHFWEAVPLQLSINPDLSCLTLPAFFSKAMRQDGFTSFTSEFS